MGTTKKSSLAGSPLAVSLLYGVFASLWILSSDWLLRQLPASHPASDTIKGLLFVGVTSLLLFLLLSILYRQREDNTAPADSLDVEYRAPPRGRRILLGVLGLVVLVALVAVGIFRLQAPHLIQEARNTFATEAELKAGRIAQWLQERRGDTLVLQNQYRDNTRLRALLDERETAHERQRLEAHFQTLLTAYHYESLALLTPDGQPIITVGNWSELDESVRQRLEGLGQEAKRLPMRQGADGHVHLDWLVPIHLDADPTPDAIFLLRAAPSTQWFPLIRQSHGTMNAMLVRVDGSEVRHLTIPAHDDDPRAFRHPVETGPFPVDALAAEADPAVVEGTDFHGKPVIAAIHPITGSDWSLIVKDSRANVLRPLHTLLAWITVIGFFALVVIAGMLLLLWRKSQQNYRLSLASRSARQDRLLRSFYDLPFIGMSITAASSRRIERVNTRMAEILGHSPEALVGENWRALTQDADGHRQPENPAAEDLIAGRIDHYRTEHQLTRPDGKELFVRFEVRATRAPSGEAEYLIATAEDITAQREAHRALRHQKDLYDFLSQTNQAVTRCESADELFHQVCEIAVVHGHLSLAWVGLIDESSGAVQPVAHYGDETGYLEQIEVSIHAWEPAGQGPVGRCIRNDRLEVMNQFQTAADSSPWHRPARQAQINSVAAFPIAREGRIIGSMALYAHESDFFDLIIRETVNDLAADLSFAMDHFDRLDALSRAREAVQASPSVLFRWRAEPGWPVEYVSENIHRWGYDATEWQNGETLFADFIHPEDFPRVDEEIAGFTESRESNFLQEYRLRMADGTYRWFEEVTRIEFDDAGEVSGYAGVLTDVHARHEIEEHERLMAQVIENTREGVIITDQNEVIVEVNPAFTNLTGYTAKEAIGRTPAFLQSGQHDRHFFRRMWSTLQREGYWQGEIWNRRKNGETFPEILSISTVADRDGSITHYVGLFLDISRQKENESKLEYLANHDPLTGLPNREQLVSRMQQLLNSAEQQGQGLGVLMIDLDRFKDINDSLGHASGDQLLIKVGERLTGRFPQIDAVARLGGDEFAVVLTGLDDDAEAGRIAEQLIHALGDPWELPNGQQVRVMASIGISLYPRFADTAHGLLQQADTALYRAKEEGRATFRYFSDEMTNAARDRISLELELRRAIDNDQLRLVFQPQINLADDSMQGAEVLVRWQHPTEGLISPDRFIPVAETTGLIWPLGRWVLEQTCRMGRRWLDEGRDFGRLAVNLSAHQLRQGEVGTLVQDILADTGMPADRLELELTESAIVRREAEARQLLSRLRAMGVHVALDDFGTGYSSLGQLRQFAIDVLKIDKRFVDLIEEPEDRGQIARVIIDLGHTLGLKVLAEGVENEAQRAFLAQHHCDTYQGYLASHPLPADEFARRYLADQTST
ncbi:EAL domain-containing protein [Guyparkeria hydrothermalis]|uniref:EAL domain-containing protein n=1 Tax=Guyparkeria hydrothermalis TaxID=923 RepID=UPI00202232BC|nr:EAL domain-containing protein [Guyparkeria hydrothermalis]MCL7745294.1 EAL domain-containing protein [Guyparkeria hydrothermalis]